MFIVGGFSFMFFIMVVVIVVMIVFVVIGVMFFRGVILDENVTFSDERLFTTWMVIVEGVNGKVVMVIFIFVFIMGN